MKRWFWKRWAWTGVFGITAAVGLALGAGKDAPPSTAAPPKVGDVMTLKFQNGPEKHVKVLKTQKRADGSYQSEVRDMKSGEVFTLVDKTHMPHAIAPTVPAVPARQASTPKAINAKPVNTQPKPIDTHISIPETKAAPPKLPAPGFSPSASMQFADPLLSDMGGATPAAASDRKLFAPSKPKTVAAPAPMPEPTPEPQKRPGFFKRLFGKDTPAAAPKVTTLTPPGTISAAPSPARARNRLPRSCRRVRSLNRAQASHRARSQPRHSCRRVRCLNRGPARGQARNPCRHSRRRTWPWSQERGQLNPRRTSEPARRRSARRGSSRAARPARTNRRAARPRGRTWVVHSIHRRTIRPSRRAARRRS